MERNQILKLSAFTFRFLAAFMLIMLALLSCGYLYWFFEPDAFGSVYLQNTDGEFSLFWEEGPHQSDHLALAELSTAMATWVFLKTAAICILLYLVFRRALRVVGSIKSLQTFKEQNVGHFRVIGSLFLWLAWL